MPADRIAGLEIGGPSAGVGNGGVGAFRDHKRHAGCGSVT